MVKCSKAAVRRLQTALRWKLPSKQRERIQMVLLREGGMTQPAIAAADWKRFDRPLGSPLVGYIFAGYFRDPQFPIPLQTTGANLIRAESSCSARLGRSH